MTTRNDSNLPNNSPATGIPELAKQTILEAKTISEKTIDANLECSLKLLDIYKDTIHTIDQQLLQGGCCPDKENRLENQRKEFLNSARKIQKSFLRSAGRSHAAFYRLAAGLTLVLALAFFCLYQSGLLFHTLDSPEETCYTELYDIDAEGTPQNLS